MRVAVLALALIALAACKEEAATAPADPLALIGTGTEWTVTEIAGTAVPAGVSVTILSPEPGMLTGTITSIKHDNPLLVQRVAQVQQKGWRRD